MKIAGTWSRAARIPLKRPYSIAFGDFDSVDMVFVRIDTEDGPVGWGAGSPVEVITGEEPAAAAAALSSDCTSWLIGKDVRHLPALARETVRRMPSLASARAALDMALHDLWAQAQGVPLVEAFGRCHLALETSVTIGILDEADALAEADEHVGHGFRVLKIKIGHDVEADVERIRRIRDRVGTDIRLRADANMGYDVDATRRFLDATAFLDVEFLEQPFPRDDLTSWRSLDPATHDRLCLDETVHDTADLLRTLSPPCAGIVNLKLMKCGGLHEARRLAEVADAARLHLMWGCMDESRVSIAAALHLALASPATRYLDLDGHLDLANDPIEGGFVLKNGELRTLDRPGLGVVGNPDVL
ncbi:MAG: dipeptide epimerase [Planctomycetes bacterium]|nr:dipeptide epimerase [Planctomycetota bacterium]